MKKKSLSINALLNVIKSVTSIVFPLITFPYVSKVLGVDNLGKFQFSFNNIELFILLSGLGISTYAIRECAKIREDKEKIEKLASELYTINLSSMLFSYIILAILLILIPKFHNYWLLMGIFSIEILFRTIGTEWIYSIFEEYAYITKRSIAFQVISIVLMFIFVRKTSDYYIYAIITVIANAGNNLLNIFNRSKLCKIKIVFKFDWKKHIKPILLIFATSIATTIYVNSDTIFLGFLSSDYYVGLYSVSVKIYKIIKTCLSAILVVSIPRLSNYIGEGDLKLYNQTFNNIFRALLTIVVPAVVGLFCLSKNIILIISDATYLEAQTSLRILSLALLVCLFGWLYNSCVLIPNNKEKQVLVATCVSAGLNILLNILLVPIWKQNAAAFTTLIAEGCSMIMCLWYSKGIVVLERMKRTIMSTTLGSFAIFAICFSIEKLNFGVIISIILSVCCSVVIYGVILIVLKNPIALSFGDIFKKKLNMLTQIKRDKN